jgi:serine/threonine protein phosphatase 1
LQGIGDGRKSVFGLLQRFTKSAARQSSVPPGQRVYAIGDVHGCRAELDQLLAAIAADCESTSAETQLIFVGDLVDRGPDSAGIIERLSSGDLPCDRRSFLMGNHEEAMLEAWDGDTETLQGWLAYGGRETLESYGIDRAETYRRGAEIVSRMHDCVPRKHIDFIRSFQDQIRVGGYLFVHAGIRPGIPLPQQDSYDLRWIRDEFLLDGETDHGVVVVHGHTISDQPEIHANRIAIDTGCFASGRLTALVLEGTERRFLST